MTWLALGDPQVKAIEELVRSDSERIIAVVGGALLDNNLGRAIEARMAPDKDRRRLLFREAGPFGGQNKTTMAYLLYMVDEETTKAMDAIYTIRNHFAHNLTTSFQSKDDDRFVSAWKTLILHERHAFYPHAFALDMKGDKVEEVSNRKDQFIVNLKLLLVLLYQDIRRHLPDSNRLSDEQMMREQIALRRKSARQKIQAKQTPTPSRK